jgi:hypothetical protein
LNSFVENALTDGTPRGKQSQTWRAVKLDGRRGLQKDGRLQTSLYLDRIVTVRCYEGKKTFYISK